MSMRIAGAPSFLSPRNSRPKGVVEARNITATAARKDFMTTPARSHSPATDRWSLPPKTASVSPPLMKGSQRAASTEKGSTAAARTRR